MLDRVETMVDTERYITNHDGLVASSHVNGFPCILCDGEVRLPNPSFQRGERGIAAVGFTTRGNLHAVRSRKTSVFTQRQSTKQSPLINTPPTPFLDVADDE